MFVVNEDALVHSQTLATIAMLFTYCEFYDVDEGKLFKFR